MRNPTISEIKIRYSQRSLFGVYYFITIIFSYFSHAAQVYVCLSACYCCCCFMCVCPFLFNLKYLAPKLLPETDTSPLSNMMSLYM